MKRAMIFSCFFALFLMISGCAVERLPSEDLEAPKFNAALIAVLKNPQLPSNSREKYEAIRELIKRVDFTFTRETKTINEFLSPTDAMVDIPQAVDRRISFNYQYGNHYVRLIFYTFRNFVVRVDVIER